MSHAMPAAIVGGHLAYPCQNSLPATWQEGFIRGLYT